MVLFQTQIRSQKRLQPDLRGSSAKGAALVVSPGKVQQAQTFCPTSFSTSAGVALHGRLSRLVLGTYQEKMDVYRDRNKKTKTYINYSSILGVSATARSGGATIRGLQMLSLLQRMVQPSHTFFAVVHEELGVYSSRGRR